MLAKNEKQRISIKDALNHEWMIKYKKKNNLKIDQRLF